MTRSCDGISAFHSCMQVQVNWLQVEDVKDSYGAIGVVESFIIKECIDKIRSSHIKNLKDLTLR